MKLFNMIESFFFLSLGVAFVLLLLLVYHFRQRVNAIEQKCDTMFEIINNVVGELNVVRSLSVASPPPMPISMEQVAGLTTDSRIPVSITNSFSEDGDSDDEEEDSDDEEEEDSDDEEEDSDDEEEDSDGDGDEDGDMPGLIPLSETVRIVNVDMDGAIDVADTDPEQEAVEVEALLEKLDSDGIETQNITVEKIDPINEDPVISANLAEKTPLSILTEPIDIYKKMNITSLRALVIEKGLVSDSSKLKKQELLRMLVPATE